MRWAMTGHHGWRVSNLRPTRPPCGCCQVVNSDLSDLDQLIETKEFDEDTQETGLPMAPTRSPVGALTNHEPALEPTAQKSQSGPSQRVGDGAILLEAREAQAPDRDRLRAGGDDQTRTARIYLHQQRSLLRRQAGEQAPAQAARLITVQRRRL